MPENKLEKEKNKQNRSPITKIYEEKRKNKNKNKDESIIICTTTKCQRLKKKEKEKKGIISLLQYDTKLSASQI